MSAVATNWSVAVCLICGEAGGSVAIQLGDSTWHGGPGWYYWCLELPDEGSVGPFETRDRALDHAGSGAEDGE